VTVDYGTPHLRTRLFMLALAVSMCVVAWRACA
jgi:hypothetical protein